jgi:dephospho-CoA kinase
MSFRLIGLAAQARSGKDTIANYLRKEHGAYVTSFAVPIRKFIAELCGYSLEELELRKEDIHRVFGVTPRFMMQTVGTEWGRDMIHKEIWIKIVEENIVKRRLIWENKNAHFLFVISDLRMMNEAEFIREQGGEIWHIVRPTTTSPANSTHESEHGLRGLTLTRNDTRILNDSSIRDLYDTIDACIATGAPVA